MTVLSAGSARDAIRARVPSLCAFNLWMILCIYFIKTELFTIKFFIIQAWLSSKFKFIWFTWENALISLSIASDTNSEVSARVGGASHRDRARIRGNGHIDSGIIQSILLEVIFRQKFLLKSEMETIFPRSFLFCTRSEERDLASKNYFLDCDRFRLNQLRSLILWNQNIRILSISFHTVTSTVFVRCKRE